MGEGSAELADLSGLPASTSAFVLSDMREHVHLFCLLGLVLTATIILVAAPGAVTWALALIEWAGGIGVTADDQSCEIDGHCLPVSALIDACMFELIASKMQSVISIMS
jgi:hypothetical protein